MGERMLSKCKKLRDKFALCLSRIQTMVPLVLAAEVRKFTVRHSLDRLCESAG